MLMTLNVVHYKNTSLKFIETLPRRHYTSRQGHKALLALLTFDSVVFLEVYLFNIIQSMLINVRAIKPF